MDTKLLLTISTAVIVIFLIAALVILLKYLRDRLKEKNSEIEQSKLAQTQIIIFAGFAMIFLLFIAGVIVQSVNSGSDKFLINLSVTIIICWIVLLICYYAWALYFYNINLGWSDDRWRRSRQEGEDPTAVDKERNINPHDEETLGLPPGTVRGTIALTLLVGALSLTIASFGMEHTTRSNTILIDNFDFYKKAFLMMIAFYFGTKSLEILQSGSTAGTKGTATATEEKTASQQSGTTTPAPAKEVNLNSLQNDFTHSDAQG